MSSDLPHPRRAQPQTTPPRRLHSVPDLAPVFVEWLQGLPPGWVSDLPLSHVAQLLAFGNGVEHAQATFAVALLLTDLTHAHTSVFEQRTAA
ncbi:hypothetical protein ACQPZ2_02220 [Nocardia pseudovaccinii]|uniref:hypothetical protein n=1 Tax=Nocardia pseudovaccinii TaxID=189540 RepID=UPI003D9480BD